MGTLATTARTGIRSYSTTHPVKAALLIRVDHLNELMEILGGEFSGVSLRLTRPLNELKEVLQRFASKCRKEGLKELGACLDSLAEHPDDLELFRSIGMWPENILEMIHELQMQMKACFEAACAIED